MIDEECEMMSNVNNTFKKIKLINKKQISPENIKKI